MHAGLTHKNMLTQGVLGGCVGLVWLGFFLQPYSYLVLKYSLDITKETEFWQAGSTLKNKTFQWGLYNFVVPRSVFIFVGQTMQTSDFVAY